MGSQSCAEVVAEPTRQSPVPSSTDNQPRSIERDFDFVERPSQDFFCPVSLELLLEPQLTSCCGHHLSLEASTRLHREGKACPTCNAEQWSAMLDKYHRRRVHELRVRCWHKDNGCDWVGEVNGLKRHDDSCTKRPWECEYCGLKCTYGEGEGKHWPTCLTFPEPCPNMCEVGSVERCNMEQHLSVCPLELVACEMKEFGCSVVVPRKELARHMRESELQHLTAMTLMNLRLTRQLQQDSTERDRKIAQLQQEMSDQKKLLTEVQTDLSRKVVELKGDIREVQLTTHHIEQHAAGGTCSGSGVITFTLYSKMRGSDTKVYSNPFYSHHSGYKFKLMIWYFTLRVNHILDSAGGFLIELNGQIAASLYLMKGEYDDQLPWPAEAKVQLELLNQAEDHHHVMRSKKLKWIKDKRDTLYTIDNSLMKYSDLEKHCDGVQYMMNDCLKFRIHVTVV